MMSLGQYSKAKAGAELETRQRQRARIAALQALPVAAFIGRTKIEQTDLAGAPLVPFDLWPAQRAALTRIAQSPRIILIKARQVGISWLVCGYLLWLLTLHERQTALLLSRGELEAEELIRRISLMHEQHEDRAGLPSLVTDNKGTLEWSQASRVVSLAATRGAGRTFAASVAVLDEFAFMNWPAATLQAVKPTVDAGGQLIIVSSADGPGTEYHRMCLAAEAGSNGYDLCFIPWDARPDRGPGWRDGKLAESGGDVAGVLREYPATMLEAFTNAAGQVYTVWSEADNVTEAADYEPGAGPLYWAVDDGYSAGSKPGTGGIDPATLEYVGDSHPRVFLLVQRKPDGRLCIVAESYACLTMSDEHIAQVLSLPYPRPEYAVHGPGAAEFAGQLHRQSISYMQSTASVDESIKVMRRALAPDANGWRRVLCHPRCSHFRHEMLSYRYGPNNAPVKAFDHGPDALRGLLWMQQYEW